MEECPSHVTYNFGQQNEHFDAELVALEELGRRTNAPLRVLVVASCGTHALSYCANKQVSEVVAADIVLSQVQLGELLRAASSVFSSSDELARWLGYDDESSHGERVAAFRERISPLLSVELASYWKGHEEWIDYGLIHAGGDARIYTLLREALTEAFPGEAATLEERVAQSTPEQVTALFAAKVTIDALLRCMPEFASELLTRLQPALCTAWGRKLHSACVSQPCKDDFVREYVLRGVVPRRLVPHLLRPGTLDAIRATGEVGPARMRFVHAASTWRPRARST